jgi:hypothetical protein
MKQHARLEPALRRSLMELNNCILKRRALNKLVSLKARHGLNFFRVAAAALQNDVYAGAHRALESHEDSASFWYIRNIAPKLIVQAADAAGVPIEQIERLAEKLKPIRDQVHSHVDRGALDDPDKPWKEAGITGNEFIWLTESAHEVLRQAMLQLTGQDFPVPEYFGDDIEDIIRAYQKEHPDAPVSI